MSIDAIGYVRRDVSRARQPWDETQIRSVAKRLGYNLRKTIVFSSDVREVEHLLRLTNRLGVDAIVVPSTRHFSGGQVPAELVQAVDVITADPEYTYARWSTGELPPEVRELDICRATAAPQPLIGACDVLRIQHHLPASIDPDTGCVLLKVGEIAAITMPSELGTRVRNTLLARRITPVPIILHTRSRRWTFLLTPDIPFDDYDLYAEMYRASVTVAPLGASVALPTPTDPDDGYRVWKELPSCSFRPSAALLVEVVRECMRPSRRSHV